MDQILSRIDKAHAAFPSLKLVCFSGGECFTLGKDLEKSIAHANNLGLATRCVSNGYWASTPEWARKRILPLAQSGLQELNLSTGDEHQQFVPFESIVNGAIEAALCGVRTLIVIEGSQEARFQKEHVLVHPRLRDFLEHSNQKLNLRLIENIWMSFHSNNQFSHTEKVYEKGSGCPSVLDHFVATPSGQMASCCGLTMEHIPEMKLGDGDDREFADLYEEQMADFLKIWLAVDGPKKILQFAIEKNSAIHMNRIAHSCEACVHLYQRKDVRDTLGRHYEEKVNDVLTRFYLTRAMRKDRLLLPVELVPEMFGA